MKLLTRCCSKMVFVKFVLVKSNLQASNIQTSSQILKPGWLHPVGPQYSNWELKTFI